MSVFDTRFSDISIHVSDCFKNIDSVFNRSHLFKTVIKQEMDDIFTYCWYFSFQFTQIFETIFFIEVVFSVLSQKLYSFISCSSLPNYSLETNRIKLSDLFIHFLWVHKNCFLNYLKHVIKSTCLLCHSSDKNLLLKRHQ